jgi:hypothetical protein
MRGRGAPDIIIAMQRPVSIDDELAAFLEGGVSIIASSSDGAGRPVVGRALGCSLSPDRSRVTLYFCASANAALAEAAAASGTVAAVFTLPSSHRSVQLKGGGVRIAPPEGDVGPALARHVEAFGRDLALIGFEEVFTRTLMSCDPSDVVALSFTPSDAFIQTPGARAGSRMAP